MDNTRLEELAPADLARIREQGRDVNRLLFARCLRRTHRLSDELSGRAARRKPLAA
jgi:hypothetical protein